MDKPLHTLSLIETVKGIESRRFTSEQYTRALLARIASLDEAILAWAWLKPEEAIKAARLSDRHLHSGGTPGPLQGIPVGSKRHLRHRRRSHGNGFSRLCRSHPGASRPGWSSGSRPKAPL